MKKTVMVDLDGTLADYSEGWQGLEHIGDPIPGSKDFLTELSKFATVVIYTTRCCEGLNGRNGKSAKELQDIIRVWLKKHDMPYDDVYAGQGKPIASCYIDDRAVYCAPQNDARAYPSALTKAKRFCDVAQDAGEKDK
jgi:hypothetical protein